MGFVLGERVFALKCDAQTLTVAWHPKAPVLAYTLDDDLGSVRLFGVLEGYVILLDIVIRYKK